MGIECELKQREEILNDVVKKCDRNLMKAPKGQLKVQRRGEKIYYSVREDNSKSDLKYVRKTELATAREIAQRDYDMTVKKAATKELGAITSYNSHLPQQPFENIFENINPGRKILITPHFVPDDKYVEIWQDEPYERKSFDKNAPVHISDRGERVRSKSEVLIANLLNSFNIPYKYECPLFVNGRKIHPDFTILKMPERKVIYWEHFGKMGDIDYVVDNMDRIFDYEKEGFFPGDSLVFTMETKEKPLNKEQILNIAEHYLLN
ncbi:MAG: hypothetical protein K6A23_11050 [Butyrivibrio sp.]|nr:hypothetical protein [Butyrivibrio sp.]